MRNALKLVSTNPLLLPYTSDETKVIEQHLYSRPDHYAGDDFYDSIGVVGRSRDSEILEESNFESALDLLGGESDDVLVVRAGHWACGWVESIRVNISNVEKTRIAIEILQDLERYPVLDDGDFSEREHEAASDYAEGAKAELSKAIVLHLGLPEELSSNEAMLDLAYGLNIECQMHYGNDSCINVYTCREPDDRDIERFVECLIQMGHNDRTNIAYQYVAAAMGLDVSND